MVSESVVKIGSGIGAYNVHIGTGIIRETGSFLLGSVPDAKRVAVFTDDVVDGLYGGVVTTSVMAHGYDVCKFVFAHGEVSKSAATYLGGLKFLAENGFTRTDVVLALGGGVVGDLAGFVAATYMRGVRYVQVPTTLLAMSDSSVGGKTAIDLDTYKNLVGAFHRPSAVIADVLTLGTLPEEQYLSGMGEIIKYACLDGGRILEITEYGVDKNNITELVSLAVRSKARIVEADEFESGARRLLNLGHTVGHAVETLSGYGVPHGIAVVKGLYAVAKACARRGELSREDFDRLGAVISRYGIDTSIPYSSEQIAECVAHDKKADGDSIRIVVMRGFGNCAVQKIALSDIKEYIT